MKNNELQRIASVSIVDAEGKIIDTVKVRDPQNVTMAILVKNTNRGEDDLAICSTSPIEMILLASNLIDKACEVAQIPRNTILKTLRK